MLDVASIKQPILDILQQYIPVGAQGLKFLTVHDHGLSAFLATVYPGVHFQPTTGAPEMLGRINECCDGLPNVQPGRHLALAHEDWCLSDKVDAIIAVHVAQSGPWEATVGLMKGAGKHLLPGGWLFLYGPFLKDGQYMSDNDEVYDTSLRMRNPEWGYRDLAEVVAAAEAQGLRKEAIHDMPAKNLIMNMMLVFRKVS